MAWCVYLTLNSLLDELALRSRETVNVIQSQRFPDSVFYVFERGWLHGMTHLSQDSLLDGARPQLSRDCRRHPITAPESVNFCPNYLVIYLGQDSLLDELVHEGLAGRVGAESEEGGHALVLLLGQVVFVEQLVRRLRPEPATTAMTNIVGLDT